MEKADAGRDPNDNAEVGLNAVVAFDCRALQVTESALVGRAFAAAEAGWIHAPAQTQATIHTGVKYTGDRGRSRVRKNSVNSLGGS